MWGVADVTNIIVIEIKCEINVMCLNHPETIPPSHPSLGKNHLPRNRSLVQQSLERAALEACILNQVPGISTHQGSLWGLWCPWPRPGLLGAKSKSNKPTRKHLQQSKFKSHSSKSRNNPCVWLARVPVGQDLPEAGAEWSGPGRGYTAEGVAWEVSRSLTGSLWCTRMTGQSLATKGNYRGWDVAQASESGEGRGILLSLCLA